MRNQNLTAKLLLKSMNFFMNRFNVPARASSLKLKKFLKSQLEV